MRRAWIAMLLVVALVLAACGSGRTGARVVADANVLDTDAVEIERAESTQPDVAEALLASPIYRITSPTSQLSAPVELRLDAPAEARWIVYYDEALGMWIPVSTERDGNELVGRVDHLSDWSTIEGDVDWLSFQLFQLTGNRTDPPRCTGQVPSWVSTFDTEPGNHPRLLACHGGKQQEATITLKNNRGYPFWVSFSDGTRPVAPSHLEPEFPTSFEELLRVGFGAVLGAGRRTYLGPGKQLTATFARPVAPPKVGRVQAHPAWDPALLGFHVLLGFLSSRGLVDIPVSGGKLLGVKALECYGKVPWASIGLADSARLVNSLGDLRECFTETVNEEVKRLEATRPNDPNLRRLKGLSRLLWAVEVTNWEQQILDAVLLDKPLMDLNRAVAYLGYTAREPPPQPCPAGARCLEEIRADLDGDRQPDRIGLYVAGEHKAARAVLATGAASTVAITERDIPDLPREPMEALEVVDADGDGRDEAIIRTGKGGNTFYPVGILKLDETRLVIVGEDKGAEAPSFTVDGGLFHGAGFRYEPVGPDGKPRLTVTEIQHEYVEAAVDPGRWAWKTRQYRWQGAALVLERADAGTLTLGPNVDPQDPRLVQYYDIHCKTR